MAWGTGGRKAVLHKATVAFNPTQPGLAALCQAGRELMTVEIEPGAGPLEVVLAADVTLTVGNTTRLLVSMWKQTCTGHCG